jgi:hypothetical protein
MPDRYYATQFVGAGFSFQAAHLDTTPFIQSYAYPDPNYAYSHEDYINHVSGCSASQMTARWSTLESPCGLPLPMVHAIRSCTASSGTVPDAGPEMWM